MKIVWKPIPIFDGRYLASSDGEIKVADDGRIVHQATRTSGYRCISIEGKDYRVHRLIGLAFGIITGDAIINHIDGIKTNNHISNLEKSTALENRRHALRMGLNPSPNWKGERNIHAKLTAQDVLYIRANCKRGQCYEFANRYGVHVTTIQRIVSKKRWKHV